MSACSKVADFLDLLNYETLLCVHFRLHYTCGMYYFLQYELYSILIVVRNMVCTKLIEYFVNFYNL